MWAKLEATVEPGPHYLRLHPIFDLNASITNPERSLGLLMRTNETFTFEQSELAGSEYVTIDYTATPGGNVTIRLALVQEQSGDMFRQLCEDLVPRVLAQKTERAAVITLVRRFNAWQRFLTRSGGQGLSKLRQLGLYGELRTLKDLFASELGPARAVSAWTGPERRPQDFEVEGIAVEVKTIVQSEPQQLKIDGERQLDGFGLAALVVAHHRVFRHQESGETLPDIVGKIREGLEDEEGPVEDFDDKLLSYGYTDRDAENYALVGYSIRDTTYYRVQAGFPRLTESDLFPGIGALRYSIDASACQRFSIEAESVASWLRSPPVVTEPGTTVESLQVEYKQTAWTPAREPENPEHERKIVRDLKTAVVRTGSRIPQHRGRRTRHRCRRCHARGHWHRG